MQSNRTTDWSNLWCNQFNWHWIHYRWRHRDFICRTLEFGGAIQNENPVTNTRQSEREKNTEKEKKRKRERERERERPVRGPSMRVSGSLPETHRCPWWRRREVGGLRRLFVCANPPDAVCLLLARQIVTVEEEDGGGWRRREEEVGDDSLWGPVFSRAWRNPNRFSRHQRNPPPVPPTSPPPTPPPSPPIKVG